MLTLKLHPRKATVAAVCRQLKLAPEQIDPDFGVVNIDPKKNLYTILVEEKAALKLGGKQGVKGPYSNPRIEPFGPPRKSPKK
jgi:hypothetical protein